MAKRNPPEINAGSMADIAFLLLIFFLVVTTFGTETGFNRKLPPKPDPNVPPPPPIKKKNIFEVVTNANDQLLVEGEVMNVSELREATKTFLDNNGDGSCGYCDGIGNSSSSDNPNKAVVSLQNNRGTSYKFYITVQNELGAAYTELRNKYAQNKFNISYDDMLLTNNKIKYVKERKKVRKAYPQKLTEPESVK